MMTRFQGLTAGPRTPEVIQVVVEIAKGSRNKIEYDPHVGAFRLDRVLYASIQYPGDYGFVPGTLAADGDALDALVLVTEPTFTGCLLEARAIGLLEMRDEKGADEKVLGVPEHDPRFGDIHELEDLPQHVIREIEYFFEIYKELEGKETAVFGWHGRAQAYRTIDDSISAYRRSERQG